MELRNVQRTGKMHYVYLPTQWCRKFKVSSSTKLMITEQADGSILVAPKLQQKKRSAVNLTIPPEYEDILIKIIMACYVNPISSFKIRMDKKIDLRSLLHQKNIMSSLEFVEIDGENITYESHMSLLEPDSLLKTMMKKIKNLIYVMIENYDSAMIKRYEEEIDRSKALIQKSIISALALNESTPLKAIDMYYTAQLAIELERIVDYTILLDKSDSVFLRELLLIIDVIKEFIENIRALDYLKAMAFTQKVIQLKEPGAHSIKTVNKGEIKRHLHNIAEIILDWAITKKIEA